MRIERSGLVFFGLAVLGHGLLGRGLLVGFDGVSGTAAEAQERAKIQQGVDYRIEAVLDKDRETLVTKARVRYTDNGYESIDTLFFHQHLNAFRPNSAWARRDREFDNRRFTDLGPDEHAFERLLSVSVDGTPVEALHSGAPDSTVVAIPLPSPVASGQTITVLMDWEARPSTLMLPPTRSSGPPGSRCRVTRAGWQPWRREPSFTRPGRRNGVPNDGDERVGIPGTDRARGRTHLCPWDPRQ